MNSQSTAPRVGRAWSSTSATRSEHPPSARTAAHLRLHAAAIPLASSGPAYTATPATAPGNTPSPHDSAAPTTTDAKGGTAVRLTEASSAVSGSAEARGKLRARRSWSEALEGRVLSRAGL